MSQVYVGFLNLLGCKESPFRKRLAKEIMVHRVLGHLMEIYIFVTCSFIRKLLKIKTLPMKEYI